MKRKIQKTCTALLALILLLTTFTMAAAQEYTTLERERQREEMRQTLDDIMRDSNINPDPIRTLDPNPPNSSTPYAGDHRAPPYQGQTSTRQRPDLVVPPVTHIPPIVPDLNPGDGFMGRQPIAPPPLGNVYFIAPPAQGIPPAGQPPVVRPPVVQPPTIVPPIGILPPGTPVITPPVVPPVGGPPTQIPQLITPTNATALTRMAINAAAPGTTPIVTFTNQSQLPLNSMQAATDTAQGRAIRFNHDTRTATGALDVRISLNPAAGTKDINVAASTTSATAQRTLNRFQRHHEGPMMVVSMEQQGNFGMEVRVTTRFDTNLNADNLFFYSFNAETNTFTRFTPTNFRVDENGFLHFTTTLAGCIIISNTRF